MPSDTNTLLKDTVRELARGLHEDTIANRRQLHADPELSFAEHRTAAFVARQLKTLNIPFVQSGGTGIAGLLHGGMPGRDRVIALRADMDALPIREMNDVPYKSANDGVMHACGHDAHTASLLTTAAILSRMKERFGGTVKFIFQPGEEKIPGGASLMIRDGVLEDPHPDCILGQHVMPELPAGMVGFRSGSYMASSDELYLTVSGKGGHAASPHLNTDPVLIACHLVTALQQIVSRQANPLMPSVLSFGRFIAEGATNVIPDEVHIAGTFRTLDEQWRSDAHLKMKKMALTLAESMGGRCSFEIRKGYPVLINEEKLNAGTRKHAEDYLGSERVTDLDIWMAAEDFAAYAQLLPGCFYRLGTGNEKRGITSGVHTPTFDIDEQALETGPGLMAYLALKTLGN
ncbi:M20 family metallopeptidase [Compostibacter hankyongensis]|uniref:M20 family metallopeptidase n=1 Tax=Compostibacter hankyongensis TaxID=1007089 RepID=A0ABP8G9S7_9BACT